MQTKIGLGMDTPKRFLADNEQEFSTLSFVYIGKNLNIAMMSTAAESPWQNEF